MRQLTARVPGTIANLGPGFDALGMAVSVYNELDLICDEPRSGDARELEARLRNASLEIKVSGEGAEDIETGRDNLIYRAMSAAFMAIGLAPSQMTLRLRNEIPFQRGLGSSAAAAVAGLKAANEVCGNPLALAALLNLAAQIEGHPDNAAPALGGGLTVCLKRDGEFQALRFALPDHYRIVLCIPDARVSTKAARAGLPTELKREEVIFTLSRAAALVGLLTQGREDGVDEAMRDVLHQPHRLKLVPGLAEALEAARRGGALGAVVSGSGPTLAAFIPAADSAKGEAIGEAMLQPLAAAGIGGRWMIVAPTPRGVEIVGD